MKKIIAFMEKSDVKKVSKGFLIALLIGLVIIDFFIKKQPLFAIERIPAFYALYGFLGCALIVAISKIAGKVFLQKREDYYD